MFNCFAMLFNSKEMVRISWFSCGSEPNPSPDSLASRYRSREDNRVEYASSHWPFDDWINPIYINAILDSIVSRPVISKDSLNSSSAFS